MPLQAVKLTVLPTHRVGIDASEGLHRLERTMMHWRQLAHVKGDARASGAREKGHLESTMFTALDKVLFQTRFASKADLLAAYKEEHALLQSLLTHTHTAGKCTEPRAKMSTPEPKARPFQSGRIEYIGERVCTLMGQAAETDGPLPGLWMRLELKRTQVGRFVEYVRSRFFQATLDDDEALEGVISLEVIIATENKVMSVLPQQLAFVSMRLESEEAVEAALMSMTARFQSEASIDAEPSTLRGHVHWCYHEPPSPHLNLSTVRLLRAKYPSFKRHVQETITEQRTSKQRLQEVKMDVMYDANVRSREGTEELPCFGSHGHGGAKRVRLASPVRQSLASKASSSSSMGSPFGLAMADDRQVVWP